MKRKTDTMKKSIAILLSLFFTMVKSQVSVPIQVINSAGGGGSVGGTGVEVYYNIGETVISTISNPFNKITQGFLQPCLLGRHGLAATALINQISCKDKTDGYITITTTITGLGTLTPTFSYCWSCSTIPSLTLCPTKDCPTIDNLRPGSYDVVVVASYGTKTDTVSISNMVINVNDAPCLITIYNGVTPNGDGVNDFFYIKNIEEYPNNVVTIYNRWGQKLDEIKSYNNTNNAWAGIDNFNHAHQAAPSGTYFYVIDLGTGGPLYKGFIELTKH